ncbi:MAG: RNA recognition motif domain-containing protein [Candidatus Methylomirabilales bacterium]
MASKLYVGNLPFEVAEGELRSLFEQAGTVESVKIITDQYSGRSRGFGFVEMTGEEEATKAIQLLNGHPLKGRSLVVSQARQEQRRGGGGRGPGRKRPGGRRPW